MKLKKYLSLSIAALSLGILSTSFIKPQPVNAVIHSYTWWAKKPRTVRVIKNHKIYEIQATFPRYKSYKIASKTLKKGTIVKINHGWSYLWIVSGHGLASNYSKGNGRFWVANGTKGWYSLNLHPKKLNKAVSRTTSIPKTRGIYTVNGSVHQYADSNVSLRINTNQFHYDSVAKQLVVPIKVKNYLTKAIPISAIISKYLEISDQEGNLVRYIGANGLIKSNNTMVIDLALNVSNAKSLTFAFPKNNAFFTYTLSNVTNSNNSNSNKTNKSATNNNASVNNSTNTATTNSSSSNTQFQWPAGVTGYVAKADYLFSLSGEQRHAADLALMKEMGCTDSKGNPVVSISRFEAQLKEITDSAKQMSNFIMNGHN